VILLALVLALAAGGCVHHPSVVDVGDTKIRPHRGRAVVQGDTARFYVELESRGTLGDTITAVRTPVARQAVLVGPAGVPVDRVEVPGATVVAFAPGLPHAVLSGLTRSLVRGEVIIVTLVLEKTGHLGVVTVVE
jgi:copper(I)-binding protein